MSGGEGRLARRLAELLEVDGLPACPRWPPDVFACCASILHETGAFERAVALEGEAVLPPDWARQAKSVGESWREAFATTNRSPDGQASEPSPPAEVLAAWDELATSEVGLDGLFREEGRTTVRLLLMLLGFSDEACKGVGVRSEDPPSGAMLPLALARLDASDWRTLCDKVPMDRVCVLPKQHTPQRGLTLRSFSHHLALIPSVGVAARWYRPNRATDRARARLDLLNILVLPWPERVDRRAFSAVRPHGDARAHLAGAFRYFRYGAPGIPDLERRLEAALVAASTEAEPVDLVVLPEMALRESELDIVARVCHRHNCALIAGMQTVPTDGQATENCAVIDTSAWLGREGNKSPTPLRGRQRKHHRWCLDASQIRGYGLEGRLPTSCDNWEWTSIGQREVGFHTVERWLTISALVCEDLARRDPVAQVVRAVGPNLVVALLMDGPQLSNRWGARYASVLAEDPGCSVLTVTSLGMAALSREHCAKMGWADRSRAVALWRDITGPDTIIELPEGANAAVLHVVCKSHEEFSADGRGDGGVAFFPVLSGWRPLSVPDAPAEASPSTMP